MSEIQQPKTVEQWQNAVDAAHALLRLEDARSYGIVKGGPQVNAERCHLLLDEGRKLGITPRSIAFERFIKEWNQKYGRKSLRSV